MPTRLDVLPDDGDVVVAVGARVLVPEADDVAQLVHHDAEFVAVFADGDGLGAPSPAAHVGAAPGGEEPGDSQLSGGECGHPGVPQPGVWGSHKTLDIWDSSLIQELQASCPGEELEPQLCWKLGELSYWHGMVQHGLARLYQPQILLPWVPTQLPAPLLASALQLSRSSPVLWSWAQGLHPRRGSHSRGNPSPNHHLLGQGRALTREDAELVQTPVSFGISPAASPGWCRATDLSPRRQTPNSITSWTPNR